MAATTPDPQTVREIARAAVREAARCYGREFVSVVTAGHEIMNEILASGDRTAFRRVCDDAESQVSAVLDELWPDEQPQAEPCPRCRYGADRHRATCVWAAGEQPQDEPESPRLFTDVDRDTNPYLRVRAFINAAMQKPDPNGMGIASIVDSAGIRYVLTEQDVEDVLDDHGEMQAEIDRLIGELVKAQDERDGDVRAVGSLLEAIDAEDERNAREYLRARFADRIDALIERDAKGGGSDG